MKKSTKNKISIIVGILSFLFFYFIILEALDSIGIITRVELAEPRLVRHGIADEELIDNIMTSVGLWAGIFSIYLAVQVGLYIRHGKFQGEMKTLDVLQTNYSIIGYTLFAWSYHFYSFLCDLLFIQTLKYETIGNLFDSIGFFAIAYLIFISFRRLYKNHCSKLQL